MDDLTGWLEVGVGVIALVVTALLFRADRKRRSLQYVVMANRAIITETKFDVEVRHGDQPVANPRLVVLRIANGGADPIAAADFETPLSLRVDGARILSAEVAYTRPPDLAPDLDEIDEGRVVLAKRLLNSFDMIEVQMLVDGEPTRLAVEGRVTGVNQIERGKIPQTSWGTPWKFSRLDKAMVWASGLVFVGIGAWFYASGGNWMARGVGIAILVLAIGVNPWWIMRRNRNNRLFLGD